MTPYLMTMDMIFTAFAVLVGLYVFGCIREIF